MQLLQGGHVLLGKTDSKGAAGSFRQRWCRGERNTLQAEGEAVSQEGPPRQGTVSTSRPRDAGEEPTDSGAAPQSQVSHPAVSDPSPWPLLAFLISPHPVF